MRSLVMSFVILSITTICSPAQACDAPKYTSAHLKTVPTSRINQKLFSEALVLEANFMRCKAGRKSLALEVPLTNIASAHSIWMAKVPKLSHTSNVAGMRRLKERARSTGLKFRTAAENIAAFDRYAFPKGEFKIRNANACKFATQDGKTIHAHSYASLARAVVTGWMTSSGHKKNLLNRRMNRAGGGLAFDKTSPFCGRYFITQNYLG